MLSVSPPLRGSGKGDYYLNLAREDYYLEGGEPPGKWHGRGAAELGLSGKVSREQLQATLDGYDPRSGAELVRNAGAETRQSAWDLTFSAPKSVSVLWSQADPETRQKIQRAHGEAVEKALTYLDENALFTRRGEGGAIRENGKLVVATFEHGTSRAQDPQLHTHALVLNLCTRDDGTTGTIESRELFQNKMTAGALYRAELASILEERLGVTTERKKSWFEVRGVSPELVKEFSKRREEIEQKLSSMGLSSQRAGDYATLDTREVKSHQPRETLFREWQEVGQKQGFSTEEVTALLKGSAPERDATAERTKAVSNSLEKLTAHQSYFSERELIRNLAEEAQGRGISSNDAITLSRETLFQNSEIVRLGERDREVKFTTKEILALEKKMLSQVERGRGDSITAEDRAVESALSEREFLSEEQKRAVLHITTAPGRVALVTGMAGTGKSTMLEAANSAWTKSGFTVYGAAFSGKAAQGLEEGSGIKSETLHKTLQQIETYQKMLDSKTVLVVDEAGMVGTRQMAALVELTERHGAKLVLIGDARQLQPIDAGGPFKVIAERVGEVKLEEIRRQRDEWSRAAVKEFAFGDSERALLRYAERGLVTVSENREQALGDVVKAWGRGGGAQEPEKHLMLSGVNQEVQKLNSLAQTERYNAGQLGEENVKVNGETIFKNDRVVFTRNSKIYGVKNGQLGTAISVDKGAEIISARLDNGEKVLIPLKWYPHLRLGYAVTTHKSQGMTVENSYILAGGGMQDRELTYVQASRARGETRFFVDKNEAGENFESLVRQMQKSHQKDLAVSVEEAARSEREGAEELRHQR